MYLIVIKVCFTNRNSVTRVVFQNIAGEPEFKLNIKIQQNFVSFYGGCCYDVDLFFPICDVFM